MLTMILGLNCEYLLTYLYGCEDDPVSLHQIGHDIRANCLYLLTRIDGCEDDPVSHQHVDHDIRVKL